MPPTGFATAWTYPRPKRAGHSGVGQTMENTDWLKGHDEAARAQADREDDRYAGQAVYKVAEVGA